MGSLGAINDANIATTMRDNSYRRPNPTEWFISGESDRLSIGDMQSPELSRRQTCCARWMLNHVAPRE